MFLANLLMSVETVAAGTLPFIGYSVDTLVSSYVSTFDMEYPAGTEVGDNAIILVSATGNMGGTISSTDWTFVASSTAGVKSQVLAQAVASLTTQTFTHSNGGVTDLTAIMLVFRGLTWGSQALATGTNDKPDPPSITSLGLTVAFGSLRNSSTVTGYPSGYTEVGARSHGSTSMAAYKIVSGTEDPGNFTCSVSDDWHGRSVTYTY
jgi:hypothetical protein